MRKYLHLLIALAIMTSCGPRTTTTYVVGKPGTDGSNGHSAIVSILHSAPTCVAGGIIVLAGTDLNDDAILDSTEVTSTAPVCSGTDGVNGSNGADGHNALVGLVATDDGGGASCSNDGITVLAGTDLNDNAVLEVAEITQSRDVCNGTNGVNGTNAVANPFDIAQLVDPCGDAPGVYDEVFLKLSNGTMVASFSQTSGGVNTRFAVLVPGSYVTTDGDSCYFSVDSNNNLQNEHH